MTSKQSVSVRLEHEIFKRIQHIAETDSRSVSKVILLTVQRGLPILEAELQAGQHSVREAQKKLAANFPQE